MRLYVAGPMTGYDNYNFDKFNTVTRELAWMGHEVYNPASSFNGAQDLPYDLYLRHAVQMVTMVNGLVLLKGWEQSRGALTEVHVALSCNMPFYEIRYTGLMVKLEQIEVDYRQLTQHMAARYLEEEIAPTNSVREGISGDSREAESWKDYVVGEPVGAQPIVEAAQLREAIEGGLRSDGSGDRGSLALEKPQDTPRYRALFPWHRPLVVGKSTDQASAD
jgi:hypothetical protein